MKMIVEFTKMNGQKIAIDIECILSIEQINNGTMINTVVYEHEVMTPYDEVIRLVSQYKNDDNIKFSKN